MDNQTHKFAHISDCHLGAWVGTPLQEMEIDAFYKTMDKCMEEGVAFIIISGDFFHSNVPNFGAVRDVVKKLKEVHDAGIPFYIVYGSHDYSPNEDSMIDILTDTGLLTKIKKGYDKDGKIKLDFITDLKTGAKITGMSGRKREIEHRYYEALDRRSLEREDGFKIFVFHSGLDELKPRTLAKINSMPISLLPRGFDYYAGGHVHKLTIEDFPNFGKVCYAGPSFAGYRRDLLDSARGTERGFILIEFNNRITDVKFIKTDPASYHYFEYNAEGKNPNDVQENIINKIEKLEVKDKIVIIKIEGELSTGRIFDINFTSINERLYSKGAIFVHLNKHDLKSKEYVTIINKNDDPHKIEESIFQEKINDVQILTNRLKGEEGAKLAMELLSILRQDKKINENKSDYEKRILDSCDKILQLEGNK